MKEFFMMGMLCLINPMTGQEQCALIHEDPIMYYSKSVCKQEAVKKVNISKKILKVVGKTNYEFGLIEEGDRVLLGLSGGKDSLSFVLIA